MAGVNEWQRRHTRLGKTERACLSFIDTHGDDSERQVPMGGGYPSEDGLGIVLPNAVLS